MTQTAPSQADPTEEGGATTAAALHTGSSDLRALITRLEATIKDIEENYKGLVINPIVHGFWYRQKKEEIMLIKETLEYTKTRMLELQCLYDGTREEIEERLQNDPILNSQEPISKRR